MNRAGRSQIARVPIYGLPPLIQPLSSQSGFSLVIIALAATLAGIVTLGNMFLLVQQKKTISAVNLHISAAMIRKNIIVLIEDEAAWNKSVQDVDNTSMQCLRSGTTCSSNQGIQNPVNILYDRLGNVRLRTHEGYEGWTSGGEACTDFNPNIKQGHLGCPFRYEVTWTPDCTGVPGCIDPPYVVQATLVFSSGDSLAFNADNYKITVNRN